MIAHSIRQRRSRLAVFAALLTFALTAVVQFLQAPTARASSPYTCYGWANIAANQRAAVGYSTCVIADGVYAQFKPITTSPLVIPNANHDRVSATVSLDTRFDEAGNDTGNYPEAGYYAGVIFNNYVDTFYTAMHYNGSYTFNPAIPNDGHNSFSQPSTNTWSDVYIYPYTQEPVQGCYNYIVNDFYQGYPDTGGLTTLACGMQDYAPRMSAGLLQTWDSYDYNNYPTGYFSPNTSPVVQFRNLIYEVAHTHTAMYWGGYSSCYADYVNRNYFGPVSFPTSFNVDAGGPNGNYGVCGGLPPDGSGPPRTNW